MLARSLRYAIARKTLAEALIGRGVALAAAGLLRDSRRRLIAGHEGVRRDAAAQLHDGVQKGLFVLQGQVQELLNGISSSSEKTHRLSTAIDGLNQKIEQQVDVLSRQLYPCALSEGLVPAFQSLRDRFGAALAVDIQLDEELVKQERADPNLLPEEVGLAAYRIAEEALANVAKHAKASKAAVRLDSSEARWLRLTVHDDGQGFDTARRLEGAGIGTMRDYAEGVGGECSIHTDPGVGTEVTAVLPLSRLRVEHLASSQEGGN